MVRATYPPPFFNGINIFSSQQHAALAGLLAITLWIKFIFTQPLDTVNLPSSTALQVLFMAASTAIAYSA